MFIQFEEKYQRMLLKCIETLNKSSNTEFEIRFGKFNYDKNTQKNNFQSLISDIDFFYKLKNMFKNQGFEIKVTNTIEYIYNTININGIKGNLKRIIDTESNEEVIIVKNTFSKFDIYDFDIRFSLANENVINQNAENIFKNVNINSYNIIREKQRYSFKLPIGKLDLTIVSETEINTENNSKKNQKYEIELEINKIASNTNNIVDEIINYITVILQTRQNNYFVISNTEKRYVMSQYKQLVNTYYFIGAQPETLQKNHISKLYNEVYSVTDKADGDRHFMLIDNKKNVYFIDNNMDKIYKTNVKSQLYYSCIIDGELININNKISFLCFDVLVYNNEDIRGNKKYLLKQRLDQLNDIITTIDSGDHENYYLIEMKKFIYKNVFIGSEIILNEVQNKLYKNDGLIFTPMNEPYPTIKKWSNLFKWKPAELNTIDFYSIKNGDEWELYVQHPISSNNKNGTKPVLFDIEEICGKKITETDKFITSKTNFDEELIDPSTGETFKSNTVIEYKWDTSLERFIPIRTRWDKTTNPNKHGNFSAVACDIWNNIHNPVEANLLFKFTASNNTDVFFDNMRKYHNKIKEYLYNKYCNKCEYLIELCSGKGGDLHKWVHNDVKKVIGYDISEKNINECNRRIEQMIQNKKYQSQNLTNYEFYKLDLNNENSSKNLLKNSNQQQADVINCHFGIHYFFSSENSVENIIDVFNKNVKKNGYVILTFMDNSEINNLLSINNFGDEVSENFCTVDNKNEILCYYKNNNEISYFIKKSKLTKQYGEQLRIILNGNNYLGEGSDEYIINYKNFYEKMDKNGFELIETQLFKEIYLNKENTLNFDQTLSLPEKNISFLNRFCVFRKKDLEENNTILPKIEKTKISTKNNIFSNFNLIDLQKLNMQVYKINTTYDIIDLINCIEYQYNKMLFDNTEINNFDDIKSLFNNLSQSCKYLGNLDNLLEENTTDICYFTHYKHSVEKKNLQGELENIDYNNWYLLMYNNQIMFQKDAHKLTEHVTPTEHVIETEHITSNNIIYNEFLERIKNEKTTIKLLKEYLERINLKTSGKKEELLNRIHDYFKN